MSFNPNELKELEKKDLHLWIVLITVFLALTVFMIYLIFYSDLSDFFQETQDVFSFNLLFLGYSGLSLLLVAYIVLRELAIRKLRRSLLEEKIDLSATLEKHYQRLKALFAVSTMVNSEVELPKIFEMISRTALNCLGGDRASLMIYDDQKRKFCCASAHGKKIEKVKDACADPEKSMCGWVLKNGNPLLLSHDRADSYPFRDLIQKESTITSALCVPLRVKGEMKGVLNVSSLSQDKSFTEEDLNLLSIFADNAAISIERAGLHKRDENFKNPGSDSSEIEITQLDSGSFIPAHPA